MDIEDAFADADVFTGDNNGIVTSTDLITGWRTYRDEYGDVPDTCRVSGQALHDMLIDSVTRDMIVTEETIYMTPSVDPERNLELFEENKRDGSFGMVMGMDIFVDDGLYRNEVLLHDSSHSIADRSVAIEG